MLKQKILLICAILVSGCDSGYESIMINKELVVACNDINGKEIFDGPTDRFYIRYKNETGSFYKNNVSALSTRKNGYVKTSKGIYHSIPEMTCNFSYATKEIPTQITPND